MRRIGLLFAILIATAAPAMGETELRPGPPRAERKLPEVRFEEVPVEDALEFLRDLTGASIVAEWEGLERSQVFKSTPVSLRLRGATLGTVLDATLAAADGGRGVAGWAQGDGVIRVATRERLGQLTLTRVYDVRDLAPWRSNAAPSTRPADAASNGDPLLALIYGSIDPKSWKHAGGAASIEEREGQLVVAATEANHLLIDNALNNLRRMTQAKAR